MKKYSYGSASKINYRKIWHHILSFVLAIVIFIASFSISFLNGFLSKNSVKNAIQNIDFYSGIKENMVEECKSVAIPSGLDSDIFDDVFTTDVIAADVKEFVAAALKGKKSNIDVSNLRQKLKTAVEQNLKSNGVKDISEYDSEIKTFCDGVMKCYKQSVEISYAHYFGQILSKAMPLAVAIFILMFIIIVVIALVMIAIYRFKVIHKTLRMVSYSFTAAGVMVLLIGLYLKINDYALRVQIKPQYLYNALQDYYSAGLKSIILMAVILFVIGMILAFSSEALRARVKRNYFNRLEDDFRERLYAETDTFGADKDTEAYKKDKENYAAFKDMAKSQLGSVAFSADDYSDKYYTEEFESVSDEIASGKLRVSKKDGEITADASQTNADKDGEKDIEK